MILHLKDGRYIDAEAYGLSTWGSLNQKYIEKKQKYWYIVESCCFDPRHDEWSKYETKLNVVEELHELPKNCKLENQSDANYFKLMYEEHKNGN